MQTPTGQALRRAYEALSGLYVMTGAHSAALNNLKLLVTMAGVSGTDKGAVLYGPSGAGKTSTVTQLERWMRSEYPAEDRDSLVMHVLVPGGATSATLAKSILLAANDPFAERGSGVDAERRMMDITRRFRSRLTVFDEFHHLFEGKDQSAYRRTAQTLKNYINVYRRPVLLVGLPAICRFVHSSDELRRRCDRFFELERFDLTREPDALDFDALVRGISEVLPCEADAKPCSAAMTFRLYVATGGTTGDAVELAKKACEVAYARGAGTVALADFSQAMRLTGRHLDAGFRDPFTMSEEELSQLQIRDDRQR